MSRHKIVFTWAEQWKADNLTDDVARLIAQAQLDLWYGPCQEDDYPGFETACRRIRAALADVPSEVYFDGDCGDWTETEPRPERCGECDGDGHGNVICGMHEGGDPSGEEPCTCVSCPFCRGEGWIEPGGEWVSLNRPALISAIVGRDLAEYVRR